MAPEEFVQSLGSFEAIEHALRETMPLDPPDPKDPHLSNFGTTENGTLWMAVGYLDSVFITNKEQELVNLFDWFAKMLIVHKVKNGGK